MTEGERPGFLTAFDVTGAWVPHPLARHSILSLQTVLGHAVWQSPQVFVGTFPDATDPGRTMTRTAPPTTGTPGLDARTLWPRRAVRPAPAKASRPRRR